jgi:DNA-binding transcriptional MerR regulator/effector-binding domain-containing protein
MEKKYFESKSYFTTSEFAKLFNVNRQTLFYYDKEGIFSPEVRLDNGHRLYSGTQYDIFYVIRMLLQSNVPLKTIKHYMEHRSPEKLKTLLVQQEIEIDNMIEQYKRTKKYLQQKLELLDYVTATPHNKFFCEECSEQYMYTTEHSRSSNPYDIAASTSDNLLFCNEMNLFYSHNLGGIIPIEDVPQNSDYNYSSFYMLLDKDEALEKAKRSKELNDNLEIKPAGTYLTILHDDGYDNIHETYQNLLEEAKRYTANHGKCFYEESLLDDMSVKGYGKYLIKLSIQV